MIENLDDFARKYGLLLADQKFIVQQIRKSILSCEGDIPTETWCGRCQERAARVMELVDRFAVLNAKARNQPWSSFSSYERGGCTGEECA